MRHNGRGEVADAPGTAAAEAGWLGEVLFFLAVCCGATYNAISARLLRVQAVMPVTALTMIAGAASTVRRRRRSRGDGQHR